MSKDETKTEYGCYYGIPDWEEPDECVFDTGDRYGCLMTRIISNKKQCKHWKPIKPKGQRND